MPAQSDNNTAKQCDRQTKVYPAFSASTNVITTIVITIVLIMKETVAMAQIIHTTKETFHNRQRLHICAVVEIDKE